MIRAIVTGITALIMVGCGTTQTTPQVTTTIEATAKTGTALLATYQEYTLMRDIAQQWVEDGVFGEDTQTVQELLDRTDKLVEAIKAGFDFKQPYQTVLLNRVVVDVWLTESEQLYQDWRSVISKHFTELPTEQRLVVQSFDQHLRELYATAKQLVEDNSTGTQTALNPQTVDTMMSVLELALRIGLEVYRGSK